MERHARRPDHRQRVARRRDRLRRAVPYDLPPMVEGNKDLKEESLSPVGYFTMYRFNFKYPPFNNKKIRQAAMYAGPGRRDEGAGRQSQVLAHLRLAVGLRHAVGNRHRQGCGGAAEHREGQGAAEGSRLRQHARADHARHRRGHAVGAAGGDRAGAAQGRLQRQPDGHGLAERGHAARLQGRARRRRLEHPQHQLVRHRRDGPGALAPPPPAATTPGSAGPTCRRSKSCAPSSR